jgi:hypothetical protein
MDVCVLHPDGEGLLPRAMKAAPGPFLTALASSREALGVCGEGLFTWDWLADLGAQEGMPCVLGHALSMTALLGQGPK